MDTIQLDYQHVARGKGLSHVASDLAYQSVIAPRLAVDTSFAYFASTPR